jgi:hypothetical protein
MGTNNQGKFQLTIPSFSSDDIFGYQGEPITSIYETSSTQKYELGTRFRMPDGRIFRYAKNGGTQLSKALMTTSQGLNARSVDELQTTSGTEVNLTDQEITIDVATGGTWTEDEYSGGYMVVNKATGIGDIYKIMANKIDDSDDTLMRVLLETPIRTALDATSELTLVQSPWYDVDVMPTTAEGTPTGIPLVTVAVNYYCWLQTGGYAPAIVDASADLTKGQVVGLDDTTAGRVMTVAADTTFVYGVIVYPAIRSEVAIIDLKLDT